MSTPVFPYKKGTILAIAGKTNHLHIICSDIFFSADRGAHSVIAVNITSIKDGLTYDDSCVLHAGEHPFIKHPSYVYYKEAVIYKVELLQQRIKKGEVFIKEDVSDPVFERIIEGFKNSKFVSRKMKKALVAAGVL